MIWVLAFLTFYLWMLGGLIMGGFYTRATDDDSLKSAMLILVCWPLAPIYFLMLKK